MAKGWLDNYGKQENYNSSKTSAPEGFEGDGFSNVGRNYSPAWGGQFQMGGTIAGAPGFSYARTQGAAPSNGKYAKKTMASAQNGKEMQYYQNGLDFQPKTISKNGSWLSKYDKAQTGKQVEYGTPEYREAYNRGEVVTDEGGRSPIQLDEVIVNKKSPAPGFWEQSKNRFLKNNQDSSVLGAIGAGVMYPFGIPQEAMMYGLTDKVQMPSEAIGFDAQEKLFASPTSFGKHASNFVLDAVTDPANLIGAGILTKEQSLARIAASKEAGLLSNAHKLNPKSYQHNLPENTMWRGLGKEGMEDAVNSGLFRSKQNVPTEYFPEKTLRMSKSFGTNPYFTPRFETASTYGDNFLAEVPRDAANWRNRYGRSDWSQIADRPIPINEGRLLQKDWWQGYKEVPKQEDGGIIKDDRGQWDHPGEITEIGSNQITMQGVPYPVLGISDTGDTQMMYPEEEYEFDGEKVTEYPMAKNGLRQEQKGLQNLDNLTNFTNYNKPTIGGWLNKYN